MRDNNREVRIRGIVEPFDEVAEKGRRCHLTYGLALFRVETSIIFHGNHPGTISDRSGTNLIQ